MAWPKPPLSQSRWLACKALEGLVESGRRYGSATSRWKCAVVAAVVAVAVVVGGGGAVGAAGAVAGRRVMDGAGAVAAECAVKWGRERARDVTKAL